MVFPDPGREISSRVGSTNYLLFNILILTLDACDCSRRFHLFIFTYAFCAMIIGAGLATFVWPDTVILDGTLTDSGWVGRFTKNGLFKTAYFGILSLMAPAMVTAWLDRDHDSCYLLTDFLLKVDLVADEQD